jgi:hypothetical protein
MKVVLVIVGAVVVVNVLFVIFALTKASGDDERKRENEKDNSDLR